MEPLATTSSANLQPSPQGVGAAHPSISPRLVFSLAAVVILAALGAVLWVLVGPGFSGRDLMTYRVTVALVCFVLSSISALLFATKASVTGTVGALTVSVAGPAAMWLIALLAFSYLFPEKDLPLADPAVHAEFFIERSENASGWWPYADWRNLLGPSVEVIRENEEGFIKNMLPRVFYRGSDVSMLRDPVVQTSFVYLGGTTVKLQRIHGSWANGRPAHVYMTGSTSLPSGKASTFFFVRDQGRIVRAEAVEQGEWREVRSNPVESLLVTLYLDDQPAAGDWLFVDLPKYRDGSGGAGIVDIDILSTAPIAAPTIWEMTASQLTDRRPAPLLFRKAGSLEAQEVKSLEPELMEWIDSLGRMLKVEGTPGAAREFLTELEKVLVKNGGGLSDWQNDHDFKERLHYRSAEIVNGTITTFLWGPAS